MSDTTTDFASMDFPPGRSFWVVGINQPKLNVCSHLNLLITNTRMIERPYYSANFTSSEMEGSGKKIDAKDMAVLSYPKKKKKSLTTSPLSPSQPFSGSHLSRSSGGAITVCGTVLTFLPGELQGMVCALQFCTSRVSRRLCVFCAAPVLESQHVYRPFG